MSSTWVLKMLKGRNVISPKMFTIEKPTVIGREKADVNLADPQVSRLHALLFLSSSGEVCVRDLDSSHGTFVNGKSIKVAGLSVGDKLVVGATELELISVTGKCLPRETEPGAIVTSRPDMYGCTPRNETEK